MTTSTLILNAFAGITCTCHPNVYLLFKFSCGVQIFHQSLVTLYLMIGIEFALVLRGKLCLHAIQLFYFTLSQLLTSHSYIEVSIKDS